MLLHLVVKLVYIDAEAVAPVFNDSSDLFAINLKLWDRSRFVSKGKLIPGHLRGVSWECPPFFIVFRAQLNKRLRSDVFNGRILA